MRDIQVIRSKIQKHVHSAWIQLSIIVMYIHSLSSFCAFEPVSISANKDILLCVNKDIIIIIIIINIIIIGSNEKNARNLGCDCA